MQLLEALTDTCQLSLLRRPACRQPAASCHVSSAGAGLCMTAQAYSSVSSTVEQHTLLQASRASDRRPCVDSHLGLSGASVAKPAHSVRVSL